MMNLLNVMANNLSFIISIVLFCLPFTREWIIKKIQLSFDKALEDKKAINERKNYINKVKFEKEFELYQSISQKEIGVVKDCGTADKLLQGLKNRSSNADNFIGKLESHIDEANAHLACYAPFIDEKIFKKYEQINSKALDIYVAFGWLYSIKYAQIHSAFISEKYTQELAKEEIKIKQKEILELFDDVHKCIRERLAELESI